MHPVSCQLDDIGCTPKISTTFEPSIKSTRFVHESFDESLPMNGFLPGFADPVESRLLLGTSIMHADISKLLARPRALLRPGPPRCISTFHRARSVCRDDDNNGILHFNLRTLPILYKESLQPVP